MDGVAAMLAVIMNNEELVQLVPASNISAGPSSLHAALARIMLESISKVDRNIPSPGTRRHVRERVQVTVQARNYSEQKAILRAVRRAAADRVNLVVAGLTAVTIHTDSAGPDGMVESASMWIGSQDFIVTYLETR